MIPPKRFDISPPDWGMLRSSCVQIFLSDFSLNNNILQNIRVCCNMQRNKIYSVERMILEAEDGLLKAPVKNILFIITFYS